MVAKKTPVKKIIKKKSQPQVEKLPETKLSFFKNIKSNVDGLLSRRPHRSFVRTRRRDYVRSLELPGYFRFTKHVSSTLWRYKKVFLVLVLLYAIISAAMFSLASQSTFAALVQTIKSSDGGIFDNGWGTIGKASLLFASTVTGTLSTSLTDVQQVYAALLAIMAWLTTVWLLRNLLAGNKVKLRDGLYSSGSPILPTFLVSLLMLLQIIPIALALVAYSAAISTGLLSNGIEGLLFWVGAGLLVVLSLYWLTGTFFALIIVTLPGMYPYRAIRAAGDLVIGRRLRILLRLLWMVLTVLIGWVIVMVPAILLDLWITGIWDASINFPLIPILLLIMSSLTIVWVSSYVYLLYRKVVADDASPA